MTYITNPETSDEDEQIAERINEMLANEFRRNPDNYLISISRDGEFHIETGENVGAME